MKILILGHKGMLGRTVLTHLKGTDHNILTTTSRWGDEVFSDSILSREPDFIINCIGKIPQKSPKDTEYTDVYIELPKFLETLNIPVIHPTTDCEFSGDLLPGQVYTKDSVRNATDPYGSSKALIGRMIEDEFKNTKMIRTSIIGHEESTSYSLLDWFLSQENSVKGYTNHYWNGITTLEWSKQALNIIENWSDTPKLTQLGLNEYLSKYELLKIVKNIYRRKNEIIPTEAAENKNKCLATDVELPDIEEQLINLRDLFSK